jgi:hypothetical protein
MDVTPAGEPPASTRARLDRLDQTAFIDVVAAALSETVLSVDDATPQTPFDLFIERDGERIGVVVHGSGDGLITDAVVTDCADICGAAGTDSVLLVAIDAVSQSAENVADSHNIYLLCNDSLVDIIDSAGVRLPTPTQ